MVFNSIWSISVAERSVILVGIVIHGIKEFCRMVSTYCSTWVFSESIRSILKSPAIIVVVFSFIFLIS